MSRQIWPPVCCICNKEFDPMCTLSNTGFSWIEKQENMIGGTIEVPLFVHTSCWFGESDGYRSHVLRTSNVIPFRYGMLG